MATDTEILKYKNAMLKALLALKEMPKNDLEELVDESGICFYLHCRVPKHMFTESNSMSHIYHIRSTVNRKLYRSWEHFSGDLYYPIETQKETGYTEFQKSTFDSMWVTGAYADLRWNLVDHMISELEKEA